jgi:hypothetical protein
VTLTSQPTAAILQQQTVEGAPRPQGADRATDLVLPPENLSERLRHFVEEVYDLSAESHVVRFMKVLLGDAGVGQIKKRLTLSRLQQALQGTHFFDLDRFYGSLFGMRRNSLERYLTDPYQGTATLAEWTDTHTKDTSYRSRIQQVGRAISYGPTPTGIELAAEAVLSVDCDVLESYYQADAGYRTYAELEAEYGPTSGHTYTDMEGVSYGDLEGSPLPRLDSPRRVFVVRPHRPITLEESYNLSRILDRIKPADSRYTIEYEGIEVHEPVALRGAYADSTYWEVISYVAARPITAVDPYLVSSPDPTEQPRPPFTGYQGEAWSYNGVLAGASAYSIDQFGSLLMPTQRVVFPDGSYYDYPASAAVMPQRYVLAGRSASDAIVTAAPYSIPRAQAPTTNALVLARETMAPVYVDRVPLDQLVMSLGQTQFAVFKESLAQRYWTTPVRDAADNTADVIEVRISSPRIVNYITFEAAHYPQGISTEVYVEGQGWQEVHYETLSDSLPSFVNPTALDPKVGDPLHSAPGHWQKYSFRIDPVTTSRVRVLLRRINAQGPQLAGYSTVLNPHFVPYSLAIRNLDIGYRITERSDVAEANVAIATTTDILGSLVEFRLYEEPASNVLLSGGTKVWRSEPQPVNYAVVNLHLDCRDEYGNGQTIDRFLVDPVNSGAHITIYWSNDEGEPTDDSFFDDVVWTPLPRDYVLQKGFIHIPPTAARWFKFEFTNLTAQAYESFVPIIRRTKLFPRWIVESYRAKQTGIAAEAMPEGLAAAVDVMAPGKFRDSIFRPILDRPTSVYPTEALYATDPASTDRLRDLDFHFGLTTWHQENDAPRFTTTSRHTYEIVEVRHTTKLSFFVGLNSIQAYRLDFEADDDTQVYVDHFWDTHNLADGWTWTFFPNTLYSGTAPVQATSVVFGSRNNIYALQFATQQTEAVQILPDPDFVNPALATYSWDDPSSWQRVGDARLAWVGTDNSVSISRSVARIDRTESADPGPFMSLIEPVFSYRDRTVEDTTAELATNGGIVSPVVTPSPEVRIWAAARVILDTDLTSPLVLQILAGNDDTVLVEKEITGHKGEMLEWYVGHDVGIVYVPPPPPVHYQYRSLISPPVEPPLGDPAQVLTSGPPPLPPDDTTVRVRLIQRGKSNDAWRLDNLSLFDEGIIWEFSVDGGNDWLPGRGIRNNQYGVLVFPGPGNQLVWRARGMRPNVAINSLKIRPWYLGAKNSRQSGTMRGPNVSTYDHDPPISQDPEFTSWTIPIPRSWWYANRRYQSLPVEGLPDVTPYRQVYIRTADDDLSGHAGAETWGAIAGDAWGGVSDETWGELGVSGGVHDHADGEVIP